MTGAVWEDWERPGPTKDGEMSPLTLLYFYVREALALLIAALGYLYLIARW